MKELEQKYEALGFTNDLIFKYVLTSDIELCRELISRIDPEIDTEGIHYVDSEKEIIIGVKDEKRVRLDIVTETPGSINDLEMFRYKPKILPKTARYNAAMIDAQLTRSKLPADLPDVNVIFLCTYDPFGYGEPIYHAQAQLYEHPECDYNEGRRICILTNKGIEKAPEKLKPVIQLLTGKNEELNDDFYRRVQAAVKEIKTDPEVRRSAMNWLEKEDAIRREGREEGHEEEVLNGIRKMIKTLRSLNLSEKEIFTMVDENYPDRKDTIREIMKA